jgi:RimJ/RimL family protein N-acetyltransferase
MSQPDIRLLGRADAALLDAFLRTHAATSMFLRSNARAAGLDDRGALFQASYLGAFAGGALVGVIAHCWNGRVLMQSPGPGILAALLEALIDLPTLARSGITGTCGDYRQVRAVMDRLKPDERSVQMDTHETLFGLELAQLKPADLAHRGQAICRRIAERDLARLLAWRFEYAVEALGAARESVKAEEEAAFLRSQLERGHGFVLEDAETGALLATAAFNAALPEIVQIGGVWTPPELRGRGYARAVVTGQLSIARADGVRDAVLFADNPAAIRIYQAIGFRRIGDFGMNFLKTPWFPAGPRP